MAMWLAVATAGRGAPPAVIGAAPASGPVATAASASQPAAMLHCVVINEASASIPHTRILLQGMGAAGWMPFHADAPDKGGQCDLPFPGGAPGLVLLTVKAPGYQEAHALFVPDPQTAVPWISVTLKGDRTLAGTVLTEDHKPVPDAIVTLDNPAGRRHGTTDAGGRFEFDELMPVPARITVDAPGIGNGSGRVNMARQTEPITIVIRPQRRVTLRVLDDDDQPVSNLLVQILSPQKMEGRTDAQGLLVVPGVGSGAAQVRVSTEDKFYGFAEPVLRLDVTEGEPPVELRSHVFHGGRIVGQVVETAAPDPPEGIPAASVWLVEGGRMGRTVPCDEDGRFELNGVPAGAYSVAAGHPTYAATLGHVDVQPGQEVALTLTLGPGSMLHGTVLDDKGTPVERAIVRVTEWQPRRGTTSQPRWPRIVELPWLATRSDGDGQYALEHLPVGQLVIEAAGAEGSRRAILRIDVPTAATDLESKIVLKPAPPAAPM
jgi:hypothetical protein